MYEEFEGESEEALDKMYEDFVINSNRKTVFPRATLLNRLAILYSELVVSEILLFEDIQRADNTDNVYYGNLRYALNMLSFTRRMMEPFRRGDAAEGPAVQKEIKDLLTVKRASYRESNNTSSRHPDSFRRRQGTVTRINKRPSSERNGKVSNDTPREQRWDGISIRNGDVGGSEQDDGVSSMATNPFNVSK
jgi:hypothetical protein